MFFTLTNRDGEATLSVIGDSFEKIVASTHPNYATLVTYFANTPEDQHDEEYVRGLVDPTVGIGRVLKEHFGDRLTFDLHHLYLDGAKINGALASLVKNRLLSADQDWLRFAKFLVNLDSNPSYKAQQAVWQWVEANGLTITEDGRFLGYKAVLEDGLSSSAGPNNYVNGVLINNGDTCRVPHEIGSVISKKRADVDDTPGGGCSVGLHVGTLEYATGFAPRLMTVAVNPADVVSAPDYDLTYKIRVCKYEVISLADPKQFESTSYDLQPEIEDNDDEQARAQEEFERADAEAFDLEPEDDGEVTEPDAQEPSRDLTLAENAALVPDLKADLHDPKIGHKPLAAKWSHLTSEASVRRYRKSNGISLSLLTKIKG